MKPVTVYSKPNCVQCTAVKRWLTQHSIPFEVLDVSEDAAARAEIAQLGYRQVPVVMHGEGHWYGYDPTRLAQILAAAQTATSES